MNANTLIAVSAYAGDLGQVETNLPAYLHHGCPVVLLTPTDAPIERISCAKVKCRSVGLKGWIGPQTLERQRLFLEVLLNEFGHSWFLFNDSDSLCLTPRIPAYLYARPDALWSNVVPDTNPGLSRLPKVALQPPYFFSRFVLERMLEGAKRPSDSYFDPTPHGDLPVPTFCIDHYMLQICASAGVPCLNFINGASFRTDTPEEIAIMVNLVQTHGHVMIHQVKHHAVYHRLVEAHAVCRRLHG